MRRTVPCRSSTRASWRCSTASSSFTLPPTAPARTASMPCSRSNAAASEASSSGPPLFLPFRQPPGGAAQEIAAPRVSCQEGGPLRRAAMRTPTDRQDRARTSARKGKCMKRNVAKLLMVLSLVMLPLTLAAPSARAGEERREHPRISRAITALQGAIAELQAAPHDFGGHRAEAVEACQAALTQLNRALQYRAANERPGH